MVSTGVSGPAQAALQQVGLGPRPRFWIVLGVRTEFSSSCWAYKLKEPVYSLRVCCGLARFFFLNSYGAPLKK